jgi:DNA-binding transcriptional regulator GbsR (MarR family)
MTSEEHLALKMKKVNLSSKRYKPSTLKKNADIVDLNDIFLNKMSFTNEIEELQSKVKDLKLSSSAKARSRGIVKKTTETKSKLSVLLEKNKASTKLLDQSKKTLEAENKRILKLFSDLEKLEESNKLD